MHRRLTLDQVDGVRVGAAREQRPDDTDVLVDRDRRAVRVVVVVVLREEETDGQVQRRLVERAEPNLGARVRARVRVRVNVRLSARVRVRVRL